ncbi:MAG: GNAT family N-acetyltransferase [Clostridia bacterium]|nr:GNAT family N-acetyltransferase [Clostridia bacterium]
MKLELLNEDNIDIAINIQKEIFPLENGSEDLKEALANICPPHQFLQKYWLAKNNDKYVGICGLYAYKSAPKDAWLGWFGVIQDERRKGFGTQILSNTIQIAKNFGFHTLRLYTDEEANDTAIKLYEKIGMIREIYNNPEDVHFKIGNTLIFSKSLTNKNTTLWNNKNLFLNSHEEKNKE